MHMLMSVCVCVPTSACVRVYWAVRMFLCLSKVRGWCVVCVRGCEHWGVCELVA